MPDYLLNYIINDATQKLTDMKNFKRLLTWTPEVYFIVFAIWWALETYFSSKNNSSVPINYPAIVLAVVLTLQFCLKNRMIGLILSSLLGMASAYLILALLSDISKSPTFDERGIRFLGFGGLLIATNITMSILMFHKYFKDNIPSNVFTAEQ